MGNGFGICVWVKTITFSGKFAAQALVILNNAIVNNRDAVRGKMRVGVSFGYATMGCPASMGDANFNK